MFGLARVEEYKWHGYQYELGFELFKISDLKNKNLCKTLIELGKASFLDRLKHFFFQINQLEVIPAFT